MFKEMMQVTMCLTKS